VTIVTADTIAFTRIESGSTDIVLLDTRTNRLTPVAESPVAEEWSPSWANSNQLLAWLEAEEEATTIAILDMKSGLSRRIKGIALAARPSDGSITAASLLSWSPDAKKLAYTTKENKVAIVEASTGIVNELQFDTLPLNYVSGRIAWTPDATCLIWMSHGVWTIDIVSGSVSFAAISIDGGVPGSNPSLEEYTSRIVFESMAYGVACESSCSIRDEDYYSQINYFTLGSSIARRITAGPHAKKWPTWSPDGMKIAYSKRKVADDWDIVSVGLDGKEEVLTNGPEADLQPAWIALERETAVEVRSWAVRSWAEIKSKWRER
jgi:Tol biopolymer transport system component